ncbi:YveK family protein [Planococcus sp. 4-30]|uniref:YveK family protein n=1 Tax=Planococcus sp. 4-30 TaxID=2874583 RepID=UPI001CC05FBB|nr:capsule biosynthesis protein CapA [Planococcus sp. 4-30]
MKNKQVILSLLMNLKKQIRFTIGLTLLLMLAVWAVFVFIIEPEHQVSSQLLIQESVPAIPHLAAEKNQVDFQTLEAYAAFVESPEVLERVRGNLGLKMSISQLRERVEVSFSGHSPVLTILVSSGSTQQAIEIADALAFTFQNAVKNSLKADNVTIISLASSQDGSINPSGNDLLSALVIAAVCGLVFSIFSAFGIAALKTAANAKKRKIRKKENQLQTVFK